MLVDGRDALLPPGIPALGTSASSSSIVVCLAGTVGNIRLRQHPAAVRRGSGGEAARRAEMKTGRYFDMPGRIAD